MASYPDSIKTWTPVVDLEDEILAEHVNGAYEEIIAIQTELKEKKLFLEVRGGRYIG